MKKFKIDFIEEPQSFSKEELEKIKGGASKNDCFCLIKGCDCKSGKTYCPSLGSSSLPTPV